MLVNTYDLSRKKTAVLQNAMGVKISETLNGVNTLNFALPYNDPKRLYCKPLHYVGDGSNLFRIVPMELKTGAAGTISYMCEHVIATLIDDVLPKYHQVGNIGFYTRDVIQYVLARQAVQNWVLGECDFAHQFEYAWENENLLVALWSISKPIAEPYIWKFDTTLYPWRVSLKRLDTNAKSSSRIYYAHNLKGMTKKVDPTNLKTRLYCYGYGEGVNQLGIESVNDGLPYLKSPQTVIDKYGIITGTWIDRRYEDAASLKAAGGVLLSQVQEPVISYSVENVDLFEASGDPMDLPKIGGMCRVADVDAGEEIKTLVVGLTREPNSPGNMTVQLANKSSDIADTITQLADRQRIEQSYSQGATNIWAQSLADNADAAHPLELQFYVPSSAIKINAVMLTWVLSAFRAYETGASAAPQTVSSTAVDGASATTSDVSSKHSSDDAFSEVEFWTMQTEKGTGSTVSNHFHSLSFPPNGMLPHMHGIAHTHTVETPSHSHGFEIPAHSHDIQYGIYEGPTANNIAIMVDDVQIPITGNEIDIAPYLATDEAGKITRGTYHKIELIPDALTHITATVTPQVFIQSRGGSDY